MKTAGRLTLIHLGEAGASHGISSNVWGGWLEAASVMFEKYHPAPPPPCSVSIVANGTSREVGVTWPSTTDVVRRSHANAIDATEHGAYVVASASLNLLAGWRVLGRTHHGSGADLLMLPPGTEDEEAFVRLEVSGVAEGEATNLRTRLRQKVDQLGRGDLDRPGVAAVVGFRLATVLVSEVQE